MATEAEARTGTRLPTLDSTFLELGPEEEAFFKSETGIQDTEELREHILKVQEDAYKVDRCSCVDSIHLYEVTMWCLVFRFTRTLASVGLDSQSSRSPGCLHIRVSSTWRRVDRGQYSWKSGVAVRICQLSLSGLLTNQCRFRFETVGAQVRKVICDGWPMSHTIATDLKPGTALGRFQCSADIMLRFWAGTGFWDLGHKLFKTTPETYHAKFLAGDVFDDAHLSLTALVPPGSPLPVASVNTLTELRGHISVILACSLFHLFDEGKQLELGKRLAALLDPRSGSIILGSHCAVPVKGQSHGVFRRMFCHSPESWTQMWEEQIFDKGEVKVKAILREVDLSGHRLEKVFPVEEEGTKFGFLFWSVERV